MQADREKILTALREKPLKTFEIMKRVNITNQEDCQSVLLRMRDDEQSSSTFIKDTG